MPMAERVDTPFTNEHFAAYCLKMVGHPYWYGTCAFKATSSLLNRKKKQYPSHYGSSRISRYRQDIANKEVVCDCVGGAKGYAWTNGGQGVFESIGADTTFSNKSGSNGCPDKGANAMFAYAKSKGCSWGAISALPEVPGLALTKDGHVGYYVGDGWAVEWKGFAYGCVKTQVSSRPWTYWYALPFIDYGDAIQTADIHIPDTSATEYVLGSRSLKKGSKGTDVKTMQELLLQLGYTLPKYGADGSFGNETWTALKAFQSKTGIRADGIYGTETHTALMAAVGDADAQIEAETTADDSAPTENAEATAGTTVVIVSKGGKVNIRYGNDTKYPRITTVAPGSTFPLVATAQNGWHAIAVDSCVGWVSGEYSRVI